MTISTSNESLSSMSMSRHYTSKKCTVLSTHHLSKQMMNQVSILQKPTQRGTTQQGFSSVTRVNNYVAPTLLLAVMSLRHVQSIVAVMTLPLIFRLLHLKRCYTMCQIRRHNTTYVGMVSGRKQSIWPYFYFREPSWWHQQHSKKVGWCCRLHDRLSFPYEENAKDVATKVLYRDRQVLSLLCRNIIFSKIREAMLVDVLEVKCVGALCWWFHS